jgi:hypothetical protein
MALVVPATGAITFSTLASVYGLSPPYKLSDLRKGGSYVPNTSDNANVKSTASNMNMSDYRNSTVEYKLTVASNTTNYNLYNSFVALYTSLSVLRKYVKLTINSGVTVGSNSSASPALDIGQFTTGTTISVVNNGNVYGAAGAAGSGGTVYNATVGAAGGATNGGSGGDAIKANYLNQTVSITNNGVVYGGGGGGGGGGKGTSGANTSQQLTPFYYARLSSNNYIFGYGENFWTSPGKITFLIDWNGTRPWIEYFDTYDTSYKTITEYVKNGVKYIRGTVQFSEDAYYNSSNPSQLTNRTVFYSIAQEITAAGIGGIGGNGGNGGNGYGYGNSITSGSLGINGGTGTNGAPTGSTGGSGGNGGNWGAAGSAGTGTKPGAGGSAGRYLLKGSATVTLTGGTIAGLLA